MWATRRVVEALWAASRAARSPSRTAARASTSRRRAELPNDREGAFGPLAFRGSRIQRSCEIERSGPGRTPNAASVEGTNATPARRTLPTQPEPGPGIAEKRSSRPGAEPAADPSRRARLAAGRRAAARRSRSASWSSPQPRSARPRRRQRLGQARASRRSTPSSTALPAGGFKAQIRRAGGAFVHHPGQLSACAYHWLGSRHPRRVPCSAQPSASRRPRESVTGSGEQSPCR